MLVVRKVEFGICEHEDLGSVREFALWFLAKGLKLHVLMLNAGIAMVPYKLVHGVESQLFVNHVAHQYLTTLLLQTLKDTRPSRVVVVSSAAHQFVAGMHVSGGLSFILAGLSMVSVGLFCGS